MASMSTSAHRKGSVLPKARPKEETHSLISRGKYLTHADKMSIGLYEKSIAPTCLTGPCAEKRRTTRGPQGLHTGAAPYALLSSVKEASGVKRNLHGSALSKISSGERHATTKPLVKQGVTQNHRGRDFVLETLAEAVLRN